MRKKKIPRETITLTEACQRLGINRGDATKAIKHKRFYFPVVHDGYDYLISKRAFDEFLEGKRLKNIRNPYRLIDYKPDLKWKPENTKYMNFPIEKEKWEKFTIIWKNINKHFLKDRKISKTALMRIAIEEFIERRPDYLHDPEDEDDTGT